MGACAAADWPTGGNHDPHRHISHSCLWGVAAAASFAMGVATADPDATTVSVPDPFGVTFVNAPDITYQSGDATEGMAYGQQTIDFDSK